MKPGVPMRASDQDRDEAVLALGEHHASGRITLPEFTARMEQALASTYLHELDPLFADLPAVRSAGAVAVTSAPARRAGPPPVVLLMVPLLVAFAVVVAVAAAGHFFLVGLPIILFWMTAGPRRHRRMQHVTPWAPRPRRHRGW
jgi:hypothetical protein